MQTGDCHHLRRVWSHEDTADVVQAKGCVDKDEGSLLMVSEALNFRSRVCTGPIRVILGLYWENGQENGNYCIV